MIHFSSPMIRFKNESYSLRSKSLMKMQSIRCFSINFFSTQTSSFFIIWNLLKCSETVDLPIFNLAVISRTVICGSESIKAVIWLTSIITGRPERGASSIFISPERNLANYFWHMRSLTASSLYTAYIFFRVCVAFLPLRK